MSILLNTAFSHISNSCPNLCSRSKRATRDYEDAKCANNLRQCLDDARNEHMRDIPQLEANQEKVHRQKKQMVVQADYRKKCTRLKPKPTLFRINGRMKRQTSIQNYASIQASSLVDVYNQLTQNTLPDAQNTLRNEVLGYYGDIMQWVGSLPDR